jgi:TrmH family RNA methyltransferase
MKLLHSRDNPFFKELKKLSTSARERAERKQALLDGAHLLQAYIDAGKQPQHVLLNAAALQHEEIISLLNRLSNVPLTQLDENLFNQLTGLKSPSGILALIDIPVTTQPVAQSRFALLLENIQDPGNLGSMLRTAAAAGCDAVFLSPACADAWSPKALRGGMGAHFVIDIHADASLPAVARAFAGKVYAAVPGAEVSLHDCDLRGRVAFAIGNEGAGVSAELLLAAVPCAIKMPGRVESLNAAAAAAVCLFEAVRQRPPNELQRAMPRRGE